MIIKNLFENMLQDVLVWNNQIYLFGLSYLFIYLVLHSEQQCHRVVKVHYVVFSIAMCHTLHTDLLRRVME